jgi:hypothetical protein
MLLERNRRQKIEYDPAILLTFENTLTADS